MNTQNHTHKRIYTHKQIDIINKQAHKHRNKNKYILTGTHKYTNIPKHTLKDRYTQNIHKEVHLTKHTHTHKHTHINTLIKNTKNHTYTESHKHNHPDTDTDTHRLL